MTDEFCIDIGVEENGYVTLLGEDTRTARVKHTCGECGRTIKPGEQYEDARWVFEGRFEHQATCSICLGIRSLFCGKWSYGNVWEDVYEYIANVDGEVCSDAILSLKPAAREKLLEAIDQYLEDTDDMYE